MEELKQSKSIQLEHLNYISISSVGVKNLLCNTLNTNCTKVKYLKQSKSVFFSNHIEGIEKSRFVFKFEFYNILYSFIMAFKPAYFSWL